MTSRTLLGVWAHPDDEAYRSAGLVAAFRRRGDRVVVITATLGERGTNDPETRPPGRLADTLLDLKVAALEAHASQTRPLIELLGPATYRQWWRTESFRRPNAGGRGIATASSAAQDRRRSGLRLTVQSQTERNHPKEELETATYTKNGMATLDATTEATLPSLAGVPAHGVRIDVNDLSRRVRVRNRGEVTLLDSVSFTVSPGELVAIVGPSGAGKTTLLEAIAGIGPETSGSVHFDGIDIHAHPGTFRNVLGYVPQEDIIHADLALQRTLRYSARLRLPSATTRDEVDDAVGDAIDGVGLNGQVDVRVGSLSGGQRKRASIAVELLTDPHLFFLDEPTSGLDPVTSAELIGHLRQLADRSGTVVFTTHSVGDLAKCDRIVFMARGGRMGFVGTLDEALAQFNVSSVPEIYRRLADPDSATYPAGTAATAAPIDANPPDGNRRPAASALTQWSVLTRRTLETFVRNRLTLAILIGSPALVVAMFAVLFRPGAFDFHNPSPSSMVMIGFWVVFAAFFFGLTYGLLQICTERTILRRERLVGLRLGAYVASKVAILVPFLLLVVTATLGVLRLLDRLPSRPLSTYASIGVGLLLCAVAALGLGLLTSATVRNVAQATLALPMLCFPAVLFSGAILPVNTVPWRRAGAAFSAVDPIALGPSKPSVTTSGARRILSSGRITARASAAGVVRRCRDPVHRLLLANPRGVRCRVPRRHLGSACSQHTQIDALSGVLSGYTGSPDSALLRAQVNCTDGPLPSCRAVRCLASDGRFMAVLRDHSC